MFILFFLFFFFLQKVDWAEKPQHNTNGTRNSKLKKMMIKDDSKEDLESDHMSTNLDEVHIAHNPLNPDNEKILQQEETTGQHTPQQKQVAQTPNGSHVPALQTHLPAMYPLASSSFTSDQGNHDITHVNSKNIDGSNNNDNKNDSINDDNDDEAIKTQASSFAFKDHNVSPLKKAVVESQITFSDDNHDELLDVI